MLVLFVCSVYIMSFFLVFLETHPTYSKKKREKISIKSLFFPEKNRYLQILNYVELLYSLLIILLYFIANKSLLNKFFDGWLILISVVFLLLKIESIESDKTTNTLIEMIINFIAPIILIIYSIINFTTGSINVIIRFLA